MCVCVEFTIEFVSEVKDRDSRGDHGKQSQIIKWCKLVCAFALGTGGKQDKEFTKLIGSQQSV